MREEDRSERGYENIENNPMQSSPAIDVLSGPTKIF